MWRCNISGLRSRAKGQRFERRIAKAFTDALGGEWRRTQGGGKDQEFVGDVRRVDSEFEFCIECKELNNTFLDAAMAGGGPIFEWWDQTKRQTGKNQFPLLICKWTRHETYAVINDKGLISINAHRSMPLPTLIFQTKEVPKETLYLMPLDDFFKLYGWEEERKKYNL